MFSYGKKIAIISVVLYALVAAAIFAFSLMPGDESVKMSNFIYSIFTFFRYGSDELPDKKDVPVEEIVISTAKNEFFVGTKTKVYFNSVTPKDHTENVTVKTSDEAVAYAENDNLFFVGEGEVNVWAESDGGVRSNVITITVLKKAPEIIDNSLFSLVAPDTLYLNDCAALGFTYNGNKSDLSVVYSLDSECLSIKNGYLISIAEGSATLSLSYEGDIVAQKTVTVMSESLPLPKLSALYLGDNAVEDEITLTLGKTYPLRAEFVDENSNKFLSMGMSSRKVGFAFSQDKVNMKVGALECGEVTVKLYSPVNKGIVLKTFTVNVVPPRAEITGIELPSPVYAGETIDFTPEVSDANMIEGLTVSSADGGAYCKIDGLNVTFEKEGRFYLVYRSDYYEDFEYTVSVVVSSWQGSTDLRKSLGHVAMFVFLGVFALLAFCYFFKKPVYKSIITVLSGLVVAVVGEVLQLPAFTVGRNASVTDVLINMGGFVIGAAITLLIIFIVYLVRKRKSRSASSETVE